jgi:ATP/maltotriose-dependent transcriptional regulator MalT
MSDLIQAFPNKMPPRPELTEREIQVLELIARGHQNKEMAHAMKIAEETAKIHVKHIFNKLGVQNRTQAVATAIHSGIMRL